MGLNSDGQENKRTGNKAPNLNDKSKRNRSHSLGNTTPHENYTRHEIDNIIGINTDKEITPSKQINKVNIPETFEKNGTYDSIFTPNDHSVRSPTNNDVTSNSSISGKKRNRSQTSPETEQIRKKQCEQTDHDEEGLQHENKSDDAMDQDGTTMNLILEALDSIELATPTDGTFRTENKATISKATYVLLKTLTKMIHRIGTWKKKT